MQAEGIDVIGFGAGEPDFDTPEHIKEAAKKALDAGMTKYTPSSGTPQLRAAIAADLAGRYGHPYTGNNVIVSCGGKHALYNIFQAICNPGDEVIIAAPYWVSYTEMVKLADAVPVIVPTTTEDNFIPSGEAIREHITPRTKIIVVCSPSNPTGTMYSQAQLEAVADLAIAHDLWVISDEIYDRLLFDDNTFVSISTLREGMAERTLICNAVSKTYSMTGWRLGWTVGPADVIETMGNVQSHSTSNPTSIAQAAALAAITGPQDAVETMRKAFEERRNVICERLDAIANVKYARPQAAFYVFPDLSGHYGRTLGGKKIEDSLDLAAYLLESANVAVVPGIAFGDDLCARLSFATSMENIEKGLDRIAKGLA